MCQKAHPPFLGTLPTGAYRLCTLSQSPLCHSERNAVKRRVSVTSTKKEAVCVIRWCRSRGLWPLEVILETPTPSTSEEEVEDDDDVILFFSLLFFSLLRTTLSLVFSGLQASCLRSAYGLLTFCPCSSFTLHPLFFSITLRLSVSSDVSSDDVEVGSLTPWGYCGQQDLILLRLRPTDGWRVAVAAERELAQYSLWSTAVLYTKYYSTLHEVLEYLLVSTGVGLSCTEKSWQVKFSSHRMCHPMV